MRNLTSLALLFLAAGVFTSVTILGGYQILMTIAVLYCTYIAFKQNSLKLPVSAYWLLAFVGVALISLVVNFDVIPDLGRNVGRLKYYLYGIGGIYVLRWWLPQVSDKTKRLILHTFLLSMIVAGVYAGWQFFFSGDNRATGLTETMRYGYGSGMVLLSLLSAILHWDKLKNILNRNFAIITFVVGFFGMYLTFTRGSLLGFLCGVPFVFYFYKKKLALTIGGGAVAIVIFLGAFYFFGTETSSIRFLSTKNLASDHIRMSQWQSAVIAIKEKPLTGWGYANFHTQVARIKKENDLKAQNYVDSHSHNLLLEMGAGTGIFGLICFLGWLITWAVECFKAGGLVRALFVPFGVAFVISSQFELTLNANLSPLVFLVYALSVASKKD